MNYSRSYLWLSLIFCSRSITCCLFKDIAQSISSCFLVNYQIFFLKYVCLHSMLISLLFTIPPIPFSPESIPARRLLPLLHSIRSHWSHQYLLCYSADQQYLTQSITLTSLKHSPHLALRKPHSSGFLLTFTVCFYQFPLLCFPPSS